MAEERQSRWERVRRSAVWRSVFRHGFEDTERNRVLTISSNVFLHVHPTKVRRHALRFRFTWFVGVISVVLLAILVGTGVALMFHYRPTVEHAYHDMKRLQFDVPFGMILRNMHRWAAHAMVVAVWLHMFRVFMTGSYKPPRELNWGIGVLLLVLTMLLALTGSLLPWDQASVWGLSVVSEMTSLTAPSGPVGPAAALAHEAAQGGPKAWLTGPEVGPATLLRVYVLHAVVLPILVMVLLAVHLWRVRKDGGVSGPP